MDTVHKTHVELTFLKIIACLDPSKRVGLLTYAGVSVSKSRSAVTTIREKGIDGSTENPVTSTRFHLQFDSFDTFDTPSALHPNFTKILAPALGEYLLVGRRYPGL